MHIQKIIISLLFLALLGYKSQAQVTDLCARTLVGLGQDSITWSGSSCSSFGGYVIYGKHSSSSNFIVLDTTNQLNFVHNNPSEVLWTYQIGLLCGNTVSQLSIAVDNQRPVTPDLKSVSIVGGKPVLSWDSSPSPEVIGYQVYKENPYGSGNYFPYPSSGSIVYGNSFKDSTASDLLVRYAIVAVSPCSKSLLGEGKQDGTTGPHTSIVLAGSVDKCAQTLNLSWNSYENWREGLSSYVLWVGRNGQTPVPVDTIASNQTSFAYTNLQDDDILEIYLLAMEKNKVNSAKTNTIYVRTEVNRPMDYLYISGITVAEEDKVDIFWTWDTDVDFSGAELKRGSNIGNLATRLNISTIVSTTNGFRDSDVIPSQQKYIYKMEATDACDSVVVSNHASTILLEGEAKEEFVNTISWNAFDIGYGTVDAYQVYKIIDGQAALIATLDSSELEYTDELNIRNQAEANNCYYVIAQATLDFPNGQKPSIESLSNKVCITQSSLIRVPNAFVPSGKNNRFRPVVAFSRSISDYQMTIFDRYGAVQYETETFNDSWDGTNNGQALPQGVYVYVIKFTQPNGEPLEKRGTVLLIR
ncbi:MAG: gliding motility-associated C-terminal domain-containing protein [Aureispira sp.]|nr:gliding motility-associated C-terminal domain-containing protein [Aureispira sp.]